MSKRWTYQDTLASLVVIVIMASAAYYYERQPKPALVTTDRRGGIVRTGQEITVPIIIETQGRVINAAELYLQFDPQDLDVVSVSKENTLFQLWIGDSPSFSQQTGEIAFAGGLPTPGFQGRGQVGTVRVRLKRSGKVQLTFTSKSRILLNDGLGTTVPLRLEPIVLRAR